MNLSDEELLQAIKIARDIASREGKDFGIVLQSTLDVMSKEKAKKVEPVKESVVQQPISEEVQVSMSDEDIAELIARNNERKAELSSETEKMAFQSQNAVEIMSYARKAEKGLLKAGFFDPTRYSLNSMNPSVRPGTNRDVVEHIKEINSLAKENSYLHYKMASPEVMEQERLNTIAAYKQLKSMGDETRKDIESNKAWGLTAMTVRAKDDVSRYDNQDIHYEGWVDGKPYSYDTLYELAGREFQFKKGIEYNQRYFGEMQQEVDQRIQQLEQMTAEEYRNFKISQMKLTPEEIELFEQHINEFREAKEASRSR